MNLKLDSSKNKSIDYSKLYCISDGMARGALETVPTEYIYNDEDLLKARFIPDLPIDFKYSGGNKPTDLIFTGFPGLYLLSEKVIKVLKENGFTGWSTYPVKVYNKLGELIDGYYGFSITGKCGDIDFSRCQKELRPSPVGVMRPIWLGLYFEESTWDGSDIFCPINKTMYTFIQENVKIALEEAKIKNIRFERVSEFEHLMLPKK